MPISSNTLFHFTNSIDNLINILKIEFHPRCSVEDFTKTLGVGYKGSKLGIPKVSFCDLPLSNVSEHLKLYGGYGIGMTKEWGIRNGINPVIYLCPQSFLAYQVQSLIASINYDKNQEASDKSFELALGFIKPYEGTMYRRGKRYNNIKFYDEREWR